MLMICASGPIGDFPGTTDAMPKATFERAIWSLDLILAKDIGPLAGAGMPRGFGFWEGNVFMC
ncbi:hypothetical protein COCMIDRAFT_86537 [Bipolaris oryzae ATCC 44560]|uniref:Uncharacterized protein n=1 Tax=Bipolaris oryzae ATCC 44560 TaxID=930090 RepID=W6ZFZ1_COCMI|nr:uncharacterized protein COCMIDRAFT_86537 [Bipolaris oryzae ATCC 44560]EUC48798.1 hypothetical protein COCMIDRAFT_86537 [Bipolaris oryzae ATCC 44560]